MKTSNTTLVTGRDSREITALEQQRIGKLARPGLLGRIFPRSIFGTQALQADLAGARADVWTVVVEAYAALDPQPDFGFVVFIDVGSSTLMGLTCGDWVADRSISNYPEQASELLTTSGQFVRAFRLERLPASGMVLRFDVLDSSPVAVRQLVSKKDVDYFGESVVFPGQLETLPDDLARYLASARNKA